jgi:hypothetical protein
MVLHDQLIGLVRTYVIKPPIRISVTLVTVVRTKTSKPFVYGKRGAERFVRNIWGHVVSASDGRDVSRIHKWEMKCQLIWRVMRVCITTCHVSTSGRRNVNWSDGQCGMHPDVSRIHEWKMKHQSIRRVMRVCALTWRASDGPVWHPSPTRVVTQTIYFGSSIYSIHHVTFGLSRTWNRIAC